METEDFGERGLVWGRMWAMADEKRRRTIARVAKQILLNATYFLLVCSSSSVLVQWTTDICITLAPANLMQRSV